MLVKKIIGRFRYYYANRSKTAKVEYLRKQGCVIGDGTELNCATIAFGTEPYLIEVGKLCLFAAGVQLFTHDGGAAVLNRLNFWGPGIERDKIGKVKIGNNVYIGTNAMVMPGVEIGDNCVIGAGAIVTKSIPSNSVAVGVPAKVICSINDYGKRAAAKTYPTGGLSKSEKKEFLKQNVK